MKYVKQFLIIIGISLAGEILKYILPLPIPASIYGMAILFIALLTGIIKLKDVRETGKFLIEIMPLMFIPQMSKQIVYIHIIIMEHEICSALTTIRIYNGYFFPCTSVS